MINIDWKHPANNTYHCTAEFKVERVGFQKHYVPEINLCLEDQDVIIDRCIEVTIANED